jgi:hypothetical protein
MTITWTNGPHGSHSGRHGTIELFTINHGFSGKKVLRGKLPGFKTDLGEFDSVEKAQERAQAVFERWLVRAELAPVRKEDTQ